MPIYPVPSAPLLPILLLIAGFQPAHADWQWREPLPQGNTLRAIAHGHEHYVAVGEAGTILISPDGDDWQAVQTGLRRSLNAITFGDGIFIAVGTDGTIARSDNGTNWSMVDTGGLTETLWHVTHGDHGFAAAGGLTLATSPDGQQWSRVDIEVEPSAFMPSLGGASYGNGRYVVPLNGDPFSTEPARLLVSDDLSQWQDHVINVPEGNWGSGPLFFRGIAFGQGRFVAAANRFERALTFRSEDGVTWEWFSSPVHNGWTLHLKSLTYDAANERFVGLSNPNDPPPSPDVFPSVVASADGGAWSHVADLMGPPIQPVAFVHDRLFGLTRFGEIYDSEDAVNWTLKTAGARAWRFQNLLHAGGVMLAVGDGPAAEPGPLQEREGVILRSTDGEQWMPVPLPAPGDAIPRQIQAAVAGNDAFVVAVRESTGMLPMPIQWAWALYVSGDGLAWRRIELDSLGDFSDFNAGIHGAGGGDGVLLISATEGVNGPVILRSTDQGETWQMLPVSGAEDTQLGAIAHGDQGFIALPYGFGTEVYRSTDGTAWTPVSAWDRPGGSLRDIAYTNGVYLITGDAWKDGAPVSWLLRSTDGGQTWQEQRFDSHSVSAVSAAGGRFVLGASGGEVLLSADGLNWAAAWTGAQAFVTGAHAGDQARLWIVTQGGGILVRDADRLLHDRFEAR